MEATKDAAMRYRSFVMRNRMLVNAAESAIQGLAFLVPVSFQCRKHVLLPLLVLFLFV
jgi:hypothetical protein